MEGIRKLELLVQIINKVDNLVMEKVLSNLKRGLNFLAAYLADVLEEFSFLRDSNQFLVQNLNFQSIIFFLARLLDVLQVYLLDQFSQEILVKIFAEDL